MKPQLSLGMAALLILTFACARSAPVPGPAVAAAAPMSWRIGGSGRDAYEWSSAGSALGNPGAQLSLRSDSATGSQFAAVSATMSADTLRGRRVRISAEIEVKGAPTGAALWLRADSAGKMLYLDNGMNQAVKGTGGSSRELTIFVPRQATDLVFGLMLSGRGAAVARDVRLRASAPVAANAPLSPRARHELDSAFAIVKAHSLWRDTVTWPAVERDVRAMAAGAQATAEVYPAITHLLMRLGDHHSFLMRPEATRAFTTGATVNRAPVVRVEADSIGYVSVFGYSGGAALAMRSFSAAFQDSLAGAVRRGATCRWVVDLRENGGGNMWPMLGGLRPFLGDGVIGYFRGGVRGDSPWSATSVDVRPSQELRSLENAYVAVLTGRRTASSGEAVAIAFRGRARTRSFGDSTAGLSTANQGFALPDSARILLTVSVQADRNGWRYGHRIAPDVLVAPDSSSDTALPRALEWLRESRCR